MGVYRLAAVIPQTCYVHVSFWHVVGQFVLGIAIAVPLLVLIFLIAFVASFVDDWWHHRKRRG